MNEPYQPGQVVVGSYEFRSILREAAAFLWIEAEHTQTGDRAIIQVLNPRIEWKDPEVEIVIEYFDSLHGIHRDGLWTPSQIIADRACPVGLIYEHKSATPFLDAIAEAAGDATPLWKQASELLHHLHNRGFQLGLVSPDSFVTVGDEVHLTSFGYTPLLQLSHHTAAEDGKGYLAPEFFKDGEVSNASDLFAFAKVLALSNPEIRDAEWFLRATSAEPSERFQRARHLFDEIERFASASADPKSEALKLDCTARPSAGGEILGGGDYQNGDRVTLEARPAKSHKFQRWEGDLKGVENPIEIRICQEMSVVAVFKREAGIVLKLEVAVQCQPIDAGLVTGLGHFAQGKKVQLEAIPNQFFEFERWRGDLESSVNPVEIVVDESKHIEAHFTKLSTAVVTALTEPRARGTVVGAGEYPPGTEVELIAKPKGGWAFSHWSGDLSGSANPTKMLLRGTKKAVAHFVRPSATVSADSDPIEAGTVSGAGSYHKGDSISLTAIPIKGWKFREWSGNVGMFFKTTNPLVLELSSDLDVVAHFDAISSPGASIAPPKAKDSVSVKLDVISNPTEGGTVSGGGHHELNASVELEAVPSEGWTFDHWSGPVTAFENRNNPLPLKLGQDKSFTAHFVRDQSKPSPPPSTGTPSGESKKRIGGAFV